MKVVIEIPDACTAIALCGGPYSNFSAVEAFLAATEAISHRFCLGDIGGFGPQPDRTLDLLRGSNVVCLKGNYDHAVGFGERDCGCGYLDPRDRAFAQISYDYTAANTGARHKAWLRGLPDLIELQWRGAKFVLCHGSPEQVSQFVWESETDDAAVDARLERLGADGICATHSGLPWIRTTGRGFWCNVGVLGRPANDGTRRVNYALVRFPREAGAACPELVPLDYDPARVVAAMRAEGLPDEFAQALERGVWTTCAAILPPHERAVARRCTRVPVQSILTSTVTDERHAAAAQSD